MEDAEHRMDFCENTFYHPKTQSQLQTQQSLMQQIHTQNSQQILDQSTFPSTSAPFYHTQGANNFPPNCNSNSNSLPPLKLSASPIAVPSMTMLAPQNNSFDHSSLSPNVFAPYSAMTTESLSPPGMDSATPSPFANLNSGIPFAPTTPSPRMPMGMSAQSPGTYSNLSDASSSHPSAKRTVSSVSQNYGNEQNVDMMAEPTSIPLNPVFIQIHNFSVEIYQSFKEDVDVLFSGNIPIQEKNRLIPNILQTVNVNLVETLETEKNYLMNEVLCPWAIRQQKYSIAPLWMQQMHYNLLNTIDTQFEYFGELLEQTLSGLQFLGENFPKLGFEDAFGRIRHIAHLFLFYSIIVSKQPPAVVVKCGEAENHRRSRFWFNTELRILGGRAFGLHQSAEKLQIQCFLITDETAKKLRTNAYYEINENEHFVIDPSTSIFQNLTIAAACDSDSTTAAFVAKFDDMRVSKKEQLRREEVWKKRYNLCFNIRIPTNAKYQIELIRKPDLELPSSINCVDMVDALEMKFQAILETPQKSTDQIVPVLPRSFLPQSKQHLINRLKPDAEGKIFLDNFLKMPVAEEYCVKRSVSGTVSNASSLANSATIGGNGPGTDPGEWKLVPFFEWFFKLAELVNKNFVQLWNDGLIFGFCGKEESEYLLSECQRPTLLIRFSDFEFAKIKISVRDRSGVIRHHWYENQDLLARSLNEELLLNAKYREVEYIYPNTNLEMAVGPRRDANPAALDRMRKPRNLQPSPIYFNNQEPAVRINSF